MKYTCIYKNWKGEKKKGNVATTADTNYCGHWLKRKTNIIKTMYKIKNSNGLFKN